MARRSIGFYDYTIGAIEVPTGRRSSQATVIVDLPAPPVTTSGAPLPRYEINPDVARRLSRQLKKWADVCDPPNRRNR